MCIFYSFSLTFLPFKNVTNFFVCTYAIIKITPYFHLEKEKAHLFREYFCCHFVPMTNLLLLFFFVFFLSVPFQNGEERILDSFHDYSPFFSQQWRKGRKDSGSVWGLFGEGAIEDYCVRVLFWIISTSTKPIYWLDFFCFLFFFSFYKHKKS